MGTSEEEEEEEGGEGGSQVNLLEEGRSNSGQKCFIIDES